MMSLLPGLLDSSLNDSFCSKAQALLAELENVHQGTESLCFWEDEFREWEKAQEYSTERCHI